MRRFLAARDPFEIVARSASLRIYGDPAPDKRPSVVVEQADVEVPQALALAQSQTIRPVPASPRNLERFWPRLSRNVISFAKMQTSRPLDEPALANVVRMVRKQTIYYRNLFTPTDCEETVHAILSRVDHVALKEIGFDLSSAFAALLAIVKKIERQMSVFLTHAHNAWHADNKSQAMEEIRYFCELSPVASRRISAAATRPTTSQASSP